MSKYKVVPISPSRNIEDAIGRARNLSASEIWEDALAAVSETGMLAITTAEYESGQAMTTNKPEVKRFHVDCNGLRAGGSPRDECDVLVVLAKDYEDLQAERDQQYFMKVRAREQRDAVTAKLKSLQAECEKLRKDALRFRFEHQNPDAMFEIELKALKENAVDIGWYRNAIDAAIHGDKS